MPAEGEFLIAGVAPHGTEPQESGRDEQFMVLRSNLIAGKLLQDEAIVWLVLVECRYDVVAVAPGAGAMAIVLKAFSFGIANDVEPVPAPALTVARACQQLIDQILIGIHRGVVDKLLDLRRRRRQSCEVKRQPADERLSIGLGRWREPCPFEPCENEAVDGRS